MSIPPVSQKNESSAATPSFENGSYYSLMMTRLAHSPLKDLVKGILAGWAEVGIDQPLVTATRMAQRRLRESTTSSTSFWKTLTFRQLYGGALANGTGMSLITGVQMWTIGAMKKVLTQGNDTQSLSMWQKLFVSSTGAIAASPLASVSEMLMDKYRENVKHYEEKGKKGIRPTYVSAIKELYKTYGIRMFTRGLGQTIGRDAGFVAAYDSLAPYFKGLLMENPVFKVIVSQQNLMPQELVATIGGSVVGGVIGVTLTHPLDTWKTRNQAGMKTLFWPRGVLSIFNESFQLMRYERNDRASLNRRIAQATVYLFKNLMAEPYKGFSFRFMRGVSAVTIFNVVGFYFDRYFAKYQ
jgi:hypothetical protein